MSRAIATIEGTLGADPELRFTPSGKAVAELRVAVDERRKNDDGDWETVSTSWYKCSVWGRMGEDITESANKGDRVVVMGRLKMEQWETDAGPRQAPAITADAVGVLPKSSSNGSSKASNDDVPW